MIIGIDTSCYTTSLAVIADNGSILEDRRIILRVKQGERGLRQSEAVFQHLQNLPRLVEDFEGFPVQAVAASVNPRPVPDSYLPVFTVGAAFGKTLASILGAPFYETSHQEGHLRAGLFNRNLPEEAFLAWHLSGGTTELLLVRPAERGFAVQKVGGTSDLQIGQFIDRVGVSLGGGFPAGAFLENLAVQSEVADSLPVVTNGLTISFSGPASAAGRLLNAGIAKEELARQVFNCINKALTKVTLEAINQFKIKTVLMVGGVSSNGIIRESLLKMATLNDFNLIFTTKELSGDNAVGVGLIGFDLVKKGLNP